MYFMYVLHVCVACMCCMYVSHVCHVCHVCHICIACMFGVKKCKLPHVVDPPGGKNPEKHNLQNQECHFLKMAWYPVLIPDSEST